MARDIDEDLDHAIIRAIYPRHRPVVIASHAEAMKAVERVKHELVASGFQVVDQRDGSKVL